MLKKTAEVITVQDATALYKSIIRKLTYLLISDYKVDFVKFLNVYDVAIDSIKNDTQNKNTKKLLQTDLVYKQTYSITASANPSVLIKHNEKVFQFFQIYNRYNRTAHYSSDNYRYFSKLVSLNTKTGFKQKSIKTLNKVFTQIYQLFEVFDNDIYTENPAYSTFYNFSRVFSDEFYKPDFLIKYVYLNLELLFLIKKVKPKKKLKKKKHTPKTLVSYLSQKSRTSITVRLINAYLNQSSDRDRSVRMRDALLYLVFSGKNSFLYKKKLSMYNKLLEKKKFY